MTEFRIIDLKKDAVDSEPHVISARSAEHAALLALGVQLVRSGSQHDLRARVYFQGAIDQPVTMVRLYGKASDRSV